MPAASAVDRKYEKQRKRDELVKGLVVAFTHFMHVTAEQHQQALTYLDGEGDENDLIYHLLCKLARDPDREIARQQLTALSNKKRKSLGARRAASILKAATPR